MLTRRVLLGSGAVVAAGAGAAWWTWPGPDPAYDKRTSENRKPLSSGTTPFDTALPEIVRYATLAANSHNTQPWIFELQGRELRIRPDESRRCPVVDPEDRHVMASLGCASENLDLAARALGFRTEFAFEPANRSVMIRFEDAAPETTAAFDAIPKRQTTRAPFDPTPLASDDFDALSGATQKPGVSARFFTERKDLNALKELVVAGNTAQCKDAAFVKELGDWVRFNQTQAAATGDGLYSGATGSPALPAWLGKRLFPLVFTASGENPKYVAQLDGSAGALVLSAEQDGPEGWFNVGRASQRFQLEAAGRDIRTSFINQPVEVAAVRKEFQSWLGNGLRPGLVLRFGKGPLMPSSLRRPVSAVLKTV